MKLYSKISKQFGFKLFIPDKATVVLPGTKGKVADFRLDATLVKGFKGQCRLSDKLLPGMDHLSQLVTVSNTGVDIPNPETSSDLSSIKHRAILETKDTRFRSILKMNLLALVTGLSLSQPFRALANFTHNTSLNRQNPVSLRANLFDHLNSEAR